jgi:hypothetical protein
MGPTLSGVRALRSFVQKAVEKAVDLETNPTSEELEALNEEAQNLLGAEFTAPFFVSRKNSKAAHDVREATQLKRYTFAPMSQRPVARAFWDVQFQNAPNELRTTVAEPIHYLRLLDLGATVESQKLTFVLALIDALIDLFAEDRGMTSVDGVRTKSDGKLQIITDQLELMCGQRFSPDAYSLSVTEEDFHKLEDRVWLQTEECLAAADGTAEQ